MTAKTSVQPEAIDLAPVGIAAKRIWGNLDTAELVEHAIRRAEGQLTAHGALRAITAPHTGRSPRDKFLVDEPGSTAEIWWDRN
ncbi:MAG: phosphoenolpyruvate carboxykinase (ATP), partial [Gemmatimonadales bacterium]